jgi:hypothetical protein
MKLDRNFNLVVENVELKNGDSTFVVCELLNEFEFSQYKLLFTQLIDRLKLVYQSDSTTAELLAIDGCYYAFDSLFGITDESMQNNANLMKKVKDLVAKELGSEAVKEFSSLIQLHSPNAKAVQLIELIKSKSRIYINSDNAYYSSDKGGINLRTLETINKNNSIIGKLQIERVIGCSLFFTLIYWLPAYYLYMSIMVGLIMLGEEERTSHMKKQHGITFTLLSFSEYKDFIQSLETTKLT